MYLLLPLSDTILLPQLRAIEEELHATNAVSTANMSLYLLAVGAGFLFWGPATGEELAMASCGSSNCYTVALAAVLQPRVSIRAHQHISWPLR